MAILAYPFKLVVKLVKFLWEKFLDWLCGPPDDPNDDHWRKQYRKWQM